MPIQSISNRLRRVLDSHGGDLSDAEIARRAEMQPPQLWRILSGNADNPGIKTIERILSAVGATLADLDEE